MKPFKPKETEFVGGLKDQIKSFIENTPVLSREVKDALLKDLGTDWNDTRFNVLDFIPRAVSQAITEWKKENLELVELWKQVAINSAIGNDSPEDVADNVVKRISETFNPEIE